jgi:hypothetical protein
MPGIHELCGKPASPLSMAFPKVVSPEASTMERATLNASVPQVPIPGALFTKKVCHLITCLEADSHGSSKMIGCILKKASRGKSKKVGTSPLSGFLKEKSFTAKARKVAL